MMDLLNCRLPSFAVELDPLIITQVINHNLGNKMLGQAGPNSITQVMIYNLGYDL